MDSSIGYQAARGLQIDMELSEQREQLFALAEQYCWMDVEVERVAQLLRASFGVGVHSAQRMKADDMAFGLEIGNDFPPPNYDWFEADKEGLTLWTTFVVIGLAIAVYAPLLLGAWKLWHYLF